MAQDWSTNFFDGGNVWSTDLQNIENALFTLRSMFSGTVAPTNPLEFAPWGDTTKHVLKNYSGVAWQGLMHGDTAQKLWVYRNTAMVGWVVDATVSDRVLAFKGGGTYTVGGAAAGSWTVSGLTATHLHGVGTLAGESHNHQWYKNQYSTDIYAWADQYYNSAGALVNFTIGGEWAPGEKTGPGIIVESSGQIRPDRWTSKVTLPMTGSTASVSAAVSSTAIWRPSASVGTLQNLDI